MTQQTKEIKSYIYQLRTKLTKAQVENKTKVMKTKLTNMLRGKPNKQTKIQHKSHPIQSSHKPLDQPQEGRNQKEE